MQINHSVTFTLQDIESAATLKRELNDVISYVNSTNALVMNGCTYNKQALMQIQDFLNDIVVSQDQMGYIKPHNGDAD
jgi:flavorubredoxin